MPALEDRRHYPRSPVSGSATLHVSGGPAAQVARIVNVSASGILLETSRLDVGTEVHLNVSGDSGHRLEFNGVVVRSDEPYPGFGQKVAVCFDEISRAAVASLKDH